MEIQNLPKYKDIRNSIRRNGRYPNVGTKVKDTIVIHHSLTPMKAKGSTPHAFANHHINSNKWPGCAYPFVITWDGTIWQTDDLDRRTYHAGNTNTCSIGICVAGDFRKKEGAREKPTQEQMESLYLLVKELKKTLPKLNRVLGHQECPGYSWKNCPGDNWDYRRVINGELVSSDDVVVSPNPPSPLPEQYIIQEGDTFWSIAKEIKGITVEQLISANPGIDPKQLKVGQKINLAKAASNPAPAKGIVVGDMVIVKKSATHFLTGQTIADFVKGSRYEVIQAKDVNRSNSKKAYLLGGIKSWVLEQDLIES